MRIEPALAQTDGLRRNLHELLIRDVAHGALERHAQRRRENERIVLAGRTHVRELLALDDVDDEIVLATVLADDHAFVHARLRIDHHRATLLQIEERVRRCFACSVRNEHALATACDLTFERRIGVEETVHDGRATRIRQQLTLIADKATRRHEEHEPRAPSA